MTDTFSGDGTTVLPASVRVQADFDRLAALTHGEWDHSTCYHEFLMRNAPPRCRHALEVGCGTGTFTRLLARRSAHILALDLSSGMIAAARARSAGFDNIEFQVADTATFPLPEGHFDVIASIATLHHLPLEVMLRKFEAALAPGGTLLILDLVQSRGAADIARSALALPVSRVLYAWHTRRVRPAAAVRAAWREHGDQDRYSTMAEVTHACRGILPGARVQRHLLWRYSLVWTKSGGST